jgi:hypothetical protein
MRTAQEETTPANPGKQAEGAPTRRGTASGDVGKLLLSHAPALLAFAAVGLYVIGLIRTVGILQAEHIPVTRGLPLAPLQDYFLRGLAVVVTPQTFLYILLLGVLSASFFAPLLAGVLLGQGSQALPEEPATNAVPDSPALVSPGRRRPLDSLPVALCAIGVLVLVPLADWLPILPGATVAALALVALMKSYGGSALPSAGRLAACVAVIFASLFWAWGMRAYFHPPPLDIATVTMKDGEAWSASLVYATGQLLYVVGEKDRASDHRHIKAVPIASVRSVEIIDGSPRSFKTVAELLGLRLWRLTYDEDKPFERSPSNLSGPLHDVKPPWEWSLP